ncbi:microcephalin isoform X2 [Triplophysa dalaica]|uniref:microcephalin isoform X2 n=1 Tax=Triplophysa dalaica TaxID=1582913 RepID=UPI0024DFB6F0|nr:microcephalin isoform X2 [Triplophysa dalaica]
MSGRTMSSTVLKDVVAYVDVWSASRMEDYSDPFIQQLLDMGAEVSKTLKKHVTHVVFKQGRPSTWKKAQKMGVKIVSVHWVASCKESGEHVNEDLYPAVNEVSKSHLLNKRTHRCMQPRDIPVKTPENDRRMKKKLDKMMEGLISSSPVVSDSSPFIIDEESGIVYSPSLKRSDSMAQRLREMRAQREQLSPTASQMQDSGSGSDASLRPSLGSSPTLSFLQQLEEEPLGCFSTSQQRSSNIKDDRTNQKGKQKSTTKLTNKLSYQTPPEPNKAAACNLSSIERTVSAASSRSKRSLVNNIEKQTTSESFIQKNSSENFSHIKHPPETESSSSPDTPIEMFKKKTNRKTVQDSNAIQTSSKLNCTRKSSSAAECLTENEDVFQKSQPSTPKAVPKISRHRRTSAALRSTDSFSNLCRSPDVNDGEAFEDFFSPANNSLKRRTSLFGSTSENVHLPTFDLEDPNKKKGRKTSAKSAGTKRKLGNIDVREILLNSSDTVNKSEETVPEKLKSRPERLSVRSEAKEMPSTEEIKLQPSAKKQRRPTRQSCIVASVEENDEGMKPCPVNERKGWTATSLTSSTAVNVKLQKTPEPDPPPKHVVGKENKSTTDGLNEKTSEMCSKGATMKKDRYVKKNRSLVMTSMPTEKQEVVFQLIRSLGGFTVVDNVCESTTHVVAASPRRTLNILLGIARGCWILSFEWILWCLEHRQWVPEEPYELSDHFPAAPICRLQQHLSAGEHQQDLFQDQPPMFVSPHSQPPCSSLTELIQLCGGTVCRSVRQAGICIGEYIGKKPEGSHSLTEQWVLDSVTHLTLLPYKNYVVE